MQGITGGAAGFCNLPADEPGPGEPIKWGLHPGHTPFHLIVLGSFLAKERKPDARPTMGYLRFSWSVCFDQ